MIMCVPDKYRSLRGGDHDIICKYLEENGFCKYINDSNFMEWMIGRDANLRKIYRKRFAEIAVAAEEYAVTENWSKVFATHAVSGFFQLLRDCGVLKDIRGSNVFTAVLSHLYFYIGLLTLDLAASAKRI